MRFVKNGPDVPDELIQQHKDGNVIFFCGAGISVPAGLPDFKNLVMKLYSEVRADFEPHEQAAFDSQRYDSAIDLLERRREKTLVRRKLFSLLQTDATRPGALDTHRALLNLAQNSSGHHRLITTNFDRLFIEANTTIRCFQAPHLPIPKRTDWDGIVYLHGLSPASDEDISGLKALVLSSGDFGRAYLTERWAARFVSELFRRFSVCFVGYSIGDPVLRYMLDAISADRQEDDEVPKMYAFGAFKGKSKPRVLVEWQAKGVIPILYRIDKRIHHRYFTETIKQWSEDYSSGRVGEVQTVQRYARRIPGKVRGDPMVDRVLWALTDSMGLGAKAFAKLHPPAPIEWLSVFSEQIYKPEDLPRFGIVIDNKAKIRPFALMARPTPYSLASTMGIYLPHPYERRWDVVMHSLVSWLALHLDKPEVLHWVIRFNAPLDSWFRSEVRRQLVQRPAGLENIPSALRVIWQLLTANNAMDGRSHLDSLFEIAESVKAFKGWTPTIESEFLALLQGRVQFYPRGNDPIDLVDESPRSPRDFARWKIHLVAGQHPFSTLAAVKEIPGYDAALVRMSFGLTENLRQTIELQEQLGAASATSDLSYLVRPSIPDHEANRNYEDWTLLIEIVRDAWQKAAELNPSLAVALYSRWRLIDYPVFRRLVFYVAAQPDQIPVEECLSLLLEDEGRWIWSSETQREAFRLIAHLVPVLDPVPTNSLIEVILRGPRRQLYEGVENEEEWIRIQRRSIWLRLAKFRQFGMTLNVDALVWLEAYEAEHPQTRIRHDDRDEFPYYMDPWEGREGVRTSLPREADDLAQALALRPEDDGAYFDDWIEICQRDSSLAMRALVRLVKRGQWSEPVWRDALNAFQDDRTVKKSWRYLHRLIAAAPMSFFQNEGNVVGHWLRTASRFAGLQPDLLLVITDRLWAAANNPTADHHDPVAGASSRPVGQSTEALIRWWYTIKPETGEGLLPELKRRFSKLLRGQERKLLDGKVMIAAQLHSFFLVDPDWTMENVLPHFDWQQHPDEAASIWKGYLRSPRISGLLLEALRTSFVAAAQHIQDIGQYSNQYAGLLTYCGVDLDKHLSRAELIRAFDALPRQELASAAEALKQIMQDAGAGAAARWSDSIRPLLSHAWPQDADKRSAAESTHLATVLILAGPDHFRAALTQFENLITPAAHLYLPLHALTNSDLLASHPRAVLQLLSKLVAIGDRPDSILRDVLNGLAMADAALIESPNYRHLDEYVRRFDL